MATKKSLFSCQECGYEAPKWLGRCPGCGSWNTLQEVTARPLRGSAKEAARITALKDVPAAAEVRLKTGIDEFDRVLGGGIVSGSVVLLGGDPGIGKSTLLLQAAARLASDHVVLYASGEESLFQLKLRSQRLQVPEDLPVIAATELDHLLQAAAELQPRVLILDSVQSFYRHEVEGTPGSLNQVREVTAALVRLAKENNIAVFLIGHVTKEGVMAGPRLLEHMG